MGDMNGFLHKYQYILFILIISGIFCLDLFVRVGRPSAFDAPTHLANIAQFTSALRDGDFPVRWFDGFANYGMPMGVIVQQTTSYLGAVFNLVFNNVVFSYNLVVFVGTFFSLLFLFKFLTFHFTKPAALLGVILFALAPYRIINIYVRGALPEYFAHVFFPLIFIGLSYWIKQREIKGLWIVLAGVVGILLTHPFTIVIGSFLFIPYALYLLFQKRGHVKGLIGVLLPLIPTLLLAVGLVAYYIIPLFVEIKYFYYGRSGQGLLPNQHLTLLNYIGDYWNYFTSHDIDVRGHVIHLGLLELFIIVSGLFFWGSKDRKSRIIPALLGVLGILIFFTTQYANGIYTSIPFLGGVQHNWRMFTSIVFIVPIIAAHIVDRTNSRVLISVIILSVLVMRVPQLYGKNYLLESDAKHYASIENLHGNILNTIWTGPTQDYPTKEMKGEIIEGRGQIVGRTEKNSQRKYTVQADTELRLVDNTFYFPGWRVYVNGGEVPIEFQDMNYRGVITYKVPPGKHTVEVVFTNTKIRLLGNTVTLGSIALLILIFFFNKKYLSSHHSSKQSA